MIDGYESEFYFISIGSLVSRVVFRDGRDFYIIRLDM